MCFSGQTLDEKTGLIWAEQGDPLVGYSEGLSPETLSLSGTHCGAFRARPAWGWARLSPCSLAVDHTPGHWGLLSFLTGPFACTARPLDASAWSLVHRWPQLSAVPAPTPTEQGNEQVRWVFTTHPDTWTSGRAFHPHFNTRSGTQRSRRCILGRQGSLSLAGCPCSDRNCSKVTHHLCFKVCQEAEGKVGLGEVSQV